MIGGFEEVLKKQFRIVNEDLVGGNLDTKESEGNNMDKLNFPNVKDKSDVLEGAFALKNLK